MFPSNPELNPVLKKVMENVPNIMLFGPNEVEYISDEEWQNLAAAIQTQQGMDYYPPIALKNRAKDGNAIVPVVKDAGEFKVIGYQSREPLLRRAIDYLSSKEVFNIRRSNFYKTHPEDQWSVPIDIAEYMTGYVYPEFQDKGVNSLSKWVLRDRLVASGKELKPTISVGVAANAVSAHVNSKMGLGLTDPNHFPLIAEFTTMLALPRGHGNRVDVLPHQWLNDLEDRRLLRSILNKDRIPDNQKCYNNYFLLISDMDKPFAMQLEHSLMHAMLTVKSKRAKYLKEVAREKLNQGGFDVERYYRQRFDKDIQRRLLPQNIVHIMMVAVGGLKLYAEKMYDPSIEDNTRFSEP